MTHVFAEDETTVTAADGVDVSRVVASVLVLVPSWRVMNTCAVVALKEVQHAVDLERLVA